MIVAASELITPEIARQILNDTEALGFSNRQERKFVIRRYADEMKAGNWQDSAETIKITKDGKLIDGFHRLNAVILSGIPTRFLVARGVNEQTFTVIDSGQKRTQADVMFIKGFRKYTAYITAAAKYLHYFVNNKRYIMGGTKLNIPICEIEAILQKHADVMMEAAAFYQSRRYTLMNISVLITLWTVFSTVDSEKARSFFETFSVGENVDRSHPCFHLRHLLISAKTKSKYIL